MARFSQAQRLSTFVLLVALAGCAMPNGRNQRAAGRVAKPVPAAATSVATEPLPASSAMPTISQVAYQTPAHAASSSPSAHEETAPLPAKISPAPVQPAVRSDDPCDPFGGQAELSVEQLVAEVEARNPSLQAVTAAWQAAAERYPQAVSLEDPMFTSMISPSGVGTMDGGGYMLQASQKLPWCGKRALRGNAASAEAEAMRGDIGDTRLRLAEMTRTAFYDYYLARQQAEVNASTRRLLAQFREIARNKYEVNQATEQDILQTDVEIARLESRRTELVRDEQVAKARINTLLHREADHPLPPPPAKVSLPDSLPTADVLQELASQSRPDLYALQARIREEQANLALACKEYYPDVNLVAKYDAFMPVEMRSQVGMDVNVPIRLNRRSAAAREASDKVAQRCAEYQDRLDQVRYEVQAGRERTSQSQRVVRLFEEKTLPATQRSLESAQVNYTAGKLDFLRLLDAERQLYSQHEMYYQSIAEYHRRWAELERAVGAPVCPNP